MIIDLNNLDIDQTRALNKIYRDNKYKFNTFVSSLYEIDNSSVSWMLSSVLSRNNNISNLYKDLCYLKLIQDFINQKNLKKIICKSSIQKILIKDFVIKNKLDLELYTKEDFKKKILMNLNPFLDFIRNIKITIRDLKSKNEQRKREIKNKKNLILLDIFITEIMVSSGKLKDRYYLGMFDNIDSSKLKNLYLYPTFLINKPYRDLVKILENENLNFIYRFDFLNITDYLYALICPLKINKIEKNKFFIFGVDTRKYIKKEYFLNRFNSSSFQGLLNYFFFKRLKNEKISITKGIDWFENQPIDKGFNLGLRKFYPEASSVGYQGFILSFNYNLHLSPTEIEYKKKLIPKKIYSIGKGLNSKITDFCSKIDVEEMSAFRFSHIYSYSSNFKKKESIHNIYLILLPISKNQSRAVMDKIIEVSSFFDERTRWLIKLHPSLNHDIFLNNLESYPKNFEICHLELSKSLQLADVVLGSSSSALVESLSYAKPVIVINNLNDIDKNPIPDNISKKAWEICMSTQEIYRSLKNMTSKNKKLDTNELLNIAEKIKSDYFEPVTEKKKTDFLF